MSWFYNIIISTYSGKAKPGDVDPRTVFNWKNTFSCRRRSAKRHQKQMHGNDTPDKHEKRRLEVMKLTIRIRIRIR